eukprot:364110-Chlamydomonas_euryale.AAC.4
MHHALHTWHPCMHAWCGLVARLCGARKRQASVVCTPCTYGTHGATAVRTRGTHALYVWYAWHNCGTHTRYTRLVRMVRMAQPRYAHAVHTPCTYGTHGITAVHTCGTHALYVWYAWHNCGTHTRYTHAHTSTQRTHAAHDDLIAADERPPSTAAACSTLAAASIVPLSSPMVASLMLRSARKLSRKLPSFAGPGRFSAAGTFRPAEWAFCSWVAASDIFARGAAPDRGSLSGGRPCRHTRPSAHRPSAHPPFSTSPFSTSAFSTPPFSTPPFSTPPFSTPPRVSATSAVTLPIATRRPSLNPPPHIPAVPDCPQTPRQRGRPSFNYTAPPPIHTPQHLQAVLKRLDNAAHELQVVAQLAVVGGGRGVRVHVLKDARLDEGQARLARAAAGQGQGP